MEDYRGHYNHPRPHSALRYQTPAGEFAVGRCSRQEGGGCRAARGVRYRNDGGDEFTAEAIGARKESSKTLSKDAACHPKELDREIQGNLRQIALTNKRGLTRDTRVTRQT